MVLFTADLIEYDYETVHGLKIRHGGTIYKPAITKSAIERATSDVFNLLRTIENEASYYAPLPTSYQVERAFRGISVYFTDGKINWFGDFKVDLSTVELQESSFKSKLIVAVLKRCSFEAWAIDEFMVFLKHRDGPQMDEK